MVFFHSINSKILEKLYTNIYFFTSLNPLLSSIVDNSWRKDPFKGIIIDIKIIIMKSS